MHKSDKTKTKWGMACFFQHLLGLNHWRLYFQVCKVEASNNRVASMCKAHRYDNPCDYFRSFYEASYIRGLRTCSVCLWCIKERSVSTLLCKILLGIFWSSALLLLIQTLFKRFLEARRQSFISGAEEAGPLWEYTSEHRQCRTGNGPRQCAISSWIPVTATPFGWGRPSSPSPSFSSSQKLWFSICETDCQCHTQTAGLSPSLLWTLVFLKGFCIG